MLFDSHNHTKFSADSQMDPRAALAKAEKLGIGLVFTEHLDIGMEGNPKFTFSPEDYFAEYSPLRDDALALGIEVGLTDVCREDNVAFIARAPFDQVIGSIHLLNGKDLYKAEAYGGAKEEVYLEYLSAMEKNLRLHSYIDVLGHIDYICRYAVYEDKELYCEVFGDAIDKVLLAALDTETVPELNTRRLAQVSAAKHLAPIYKRYRELGGGFVTIGSDAHNVETVGKSLDVALTIAKEAELIPVTFRERRMAVCGNL